MVPIVPVLPGTIYYIPTQRSAERCNVSFTAILSLEYMGLMVQVEPHTADTTVTVVGDTHGQFHDVCEM